MTTDDLARLRSLAEAATAEQVSEDAYSRRYPRRQWQDETHRAEFREATDPQTVLALLDAAALGLAWNRVEAALPEGWQMSTMRAAVGFNGSRASTTGWTATAYGGYGIPAEHRVESDVSPTPTAALLALADKLEAREP